MNPIVKHHIAERRRIARRIRQLRSVRLGRGPTGRGPNPYVKEIVYSTEYDIPCKPTAENLFEEFVGLLEFAASPLPGLDGIGNYVWDERYSMCGLADGHAQDRKDAEDTALEYFQAWQEVAGFGEDEARRQAKAELSEVAGRRFEAWFRVREGVHA